MVDGGEQEITVGDIFSSFEEVKKKTEEYS